MNITKHVLPEHKEEAESELRRFESLVLRIAHEANKGNFLSVTRIKIKVFESLEKLIELSTKKQQKEQLQEIADQMVTNGTEIEAIRRAYQL